VSANQGYPWPTQNRTDNAERLQSFARILVVLGVCLGVIGVIVGFSMAFHATVIGCPDGHFFPAGTTDFRCFAHKHAGDGTAIAVFSALLAIVVGLCGIIAVGTRVDRAARPESEPADDATQ
jgi:hypothetical protein